MQLINSIQLKYLPVYTKLGEYVGRVIDFDVDCATFKIMTLHVCMKSLLPFMGRSLLIGVESIVEITPRGVIIEELVAQEKITNPDLGLVTE